MTAHNLVAYASGPSFCAISVNNPSVAEPDNERVIITGIESTGMDNLFNTGARQFDIQSIAPDALNIDIQTIIATRYGIMFTATLNPSFAPSTKAS